MGEDRLRGWKLLLAAAMAFGVPAAAGAESAGHKAATHKPITVHLVGDMMFDNEVADNIGKYGIDFPFAKMPMLGKADLTFGNLETSVSTRGAAADKQYTFRSAPSTLRSLLNAGFDGVSLANNHTLDYGTVALMDTIRHLDRYKLGHTGAGANENEAYKPFVRTVNGKKVAIVGISRVLPETSWYAGPDKPGIAQGYSTEPMMSRIREAAKSSDYTIVFIHWNKERVDYPEPYARKYAKMFIDAGADAVIGAHSHCLQGIEWYKDKPIYYSLGNFVFTSKAEKSRMTIMAALTFEGGRVTTRVVPAKIENTRPRLADADYGRKTIAKLNGISFNAFVKPDGTVVRTRT